MDFSPPKRRKVSHSGGTSYDSSGTASKMTATAGIYRPSTFLLETTELLKEVKVDYGKTFNGADDLLHKIKSAIEDIKPHDALPIFEASSKLEKQHKVIVPFPQPRPVSDSPYKVSLAKPSQFNVVGSYVSRTMIKSQAHHSIDMIFELPENLFQEKDFLNLRYFYKRAYYVAKVLVAVRTQLASSVLLSYEYLNENSLLPVVLIKAKGDANTINKYSIRLIPCIPNALFPRQKLLASSNAIRAVLSSEKETASRPTPFYNSTLKAEGNYMAYLKLLRQSEKSCSSFKDACVLGRVWLLQRGLDGSVSNGGFGHFEWAVLLGLLLQGGARKGQAALSSSLSSPQLFKAMIQFIAATDFLTKPLVLGPSPDDLDSVRETGPVIYDAARQLNLAFKMSSWSAALLRQHAQWTHALLLDKSVDQFNPTFILRADLPLQLFDMLVELNTSVDISSPFDADRQDPLWAFGNKVFRVLKRALGDRAKLVQLQLPGKEGWQVDNPPVESLPSTILVGVLFDPLNTSRQVDQGPSVEEKDEAKKFRQFWGEKAELRRLKDGSILESLIWTKNTPFDICEEIIRYILELHLKLDAEELRFGGKAFTAQVPIRQTDSLAFTSARQAFDQLESQIRELEDLPLRVRQIVPTDPRLRSASVKAPVAGSHKSDLYPMDVVLYFEASGKWPDNLAAIQRTKIAFLAKIASLFDNTNNGVITMIGLEEAQTDIENLAFLDMIYESGYAFRVRIQSDLEENLLERRTKDKTLEQPLRAESAALLATYRRLYNILPLHTQTIRTYFTRFPALSASIRLVKHWFDSHKLSCHFNEDFIELAVLHVFLEPYPWDSPSSAMTGFLRTLLFLSHWDWRVEPLVVDSAESVAPADRAAIGTRFEAWRKIDPNMNQTVLFVATSNDASGTAHTTRGSEAAPSRVVATRMTTLARSACRVVKETGTSTTNITSFDPRVLFQPSLHDYDFLIRLAPKAVRSLARGEDPAAKHSQFKNLDERTTASQAPAGYPPLESLLTRLNTTYAGPLVFFHGSHDGDAVVAAIWNPQIRRRSFRPKLPCSFKPVDGGSDKDDDDDDDGDLVEINREAIMAEIARVCGDLVEKIEVKGQDH